MWEFRNYYVMYAYANRIIKSDDKEDEEVMILILFRTYNILTVGKKKKETIIPIAKKLISSIGKLIESYHFKMFSMPK